MVAKRPREDVMVANTTLVQSSVPLVHATGAAHSGGQQHYPGPRAQDPYQNVEQQLSEVRHCRA